MIRFLIFLSVFVSSQAFALELTSGSQSSIQALVHSVDDQPVNGFGVGGGLPGNVNGMGMEFGANQKVKLDVMLMQNATSVGKFTTEVMTGAEANKYLENTNLLSEFIKKGGNVNISANPSGRELSLAVQKLRDSKDLKTVKWMHEIEIDKLKSQIDFYKRSCKGNAFGNGMGMGAGFGSIGEQPARPKRERRNGPAAPAAR